MSNFFAGFTGSELIVMLVGAIYSVFQVFVSGASPLEWLKEKLGLADVAMQWAVIIFFMILSALAQFVAGELSGFEFTLAGIINYFGVWYGMSQLAYEVLKKRRNGE
jgi:hypothetical protein